MRLATPAASPRASRRDPSILKGGGSFRSRRAPAVTFNVENEQESDDDGHITFSAPTRRERPSSLLVAPDDAPVVPPLGARSLSVEDSTRSTSPILDLKLRGLRRTAEILRKVSSAERLTRLRDKIMARGGGSRERSPPRDEPSDDESAPLVSPPGAKAPLTVVTQPSSPSPHSDASTIAKGGEVGESSPAEGTASAELSPRSDVTELDSPRDTGAAFDLLPSGKSDERSTASARPQRSDSDGSVSNMMEPYNMRLLAHGTADGGRGLWRQDALDSDPPWPWDEPDSAV